MLDWSGGVSGRPHSDQDGLTSLFGEGLVMRALSCVAEVHVALVVASVQLKEVVGPIGHDPRFVA